MEILIVWAVFALIIISNIKKAKKMQNERMQEHQRNMQDHNQNVPEYGRNMHQMQNNSSGNGSLSHGANLNKKNDSDAQSAPYMVNSYGEKQYIDPSVQTYSGTQKMTSAETEKLKQEIQEITLMERMLLRIEQRHRFRNMLLHRQQQIMLHLQ